MSSFNSRFCGVILNILILSGTASALENERTPGIVEIKVSNHPADRQYVVSEAGDDNFGTQVFLIITSRSGAIIRADSLIGDDAIRYVLYLKDGTLLSRRLSDALLGQSLRDITLGFVNDGRILMLEEPHTIYLTSFSDKVLVRTNARLN